MLFYFLFVLYCNKISILIATFTYRWSLHQLCRESYTSSWLWLFFEMQIRIWLNYRRIDGKCFTSTKMDLAVKKSVPGILDLRAIPSLQEISISLNCNFYLKCEMHDVKYMIKYISLFAFDSVFSSFYILLDY